MTAESGGEDKVYGNYCVGCVTHNDNAHWGKYCLKEQQPAEENMSDNKSESVKSCPLCGDELEEFKKRILDKIETMGTDYMNYLLDAEQRCSVFKKNALNWNSRCGS